MSQSKYGNILTVILVILIVIILVIGAVFFIKWLKEEKVKKENERVISEISKNIDAGQEEEKQGEDEVVVPELTNITGEQQTSGGSSSGGVGTKRKKVYMSGFVAAGYIEIPKTGIKYAVLETTSVKALETAVAVVYPSNPQLNTPGNVVIQGHNYRNGKFFSNNKKLQIGDKIKITDLNNKTLTYTIYEIFETTDTDAAYFTRDTGDNIEISLSTCTDDGKNRLVILARV